jgi:5-methylcytosine-specific restriction endonuclease McrA
VAHQRFHGRPAQRARDTLRRKALPCWLCGEPIDYRLPPSDPMSFTLDHEHPQKHNPGLIWDKAGHRPAHRRCNSRRGTGSPDSIKPPPRSREW